MTQNILQTLSTDAKIELIKRLAETDPLSIIDKSLLKIKNTNSQTIPLVLNSVQRKIYNIIKQYYGKRPIRIIVLKARKQGVSTLIEAIFYALTSQKQNIDALVLAHEAKAASNIFDMSKFYHEHLETELPFLTTELKKNNAKMLEFDGKNSKFAVSVEGEIRSFTFNLVHCSEVAFYANPIQTFAALNNAIPKTDTSIMVLESTANGVGNYFHHVWSDAIDLKEWVNDKYNTEPVYLKLFFPWFENNENTIPASEDEVLDIPERHKIAINEMWKRYNLTKSQIKWYVNTLRVNCFGDIDLMRQEHPSNDIEAFLKSGHPVFNVADLYDVYNKEKELHDAFVYKKYNFEEYGTEYRLKLGQELGLYGDVEVYQHYRDTQHYAIVCDTAEGGDIGDTSVANVFDIVTGDQCANVRFNGDVTMFAQKVYMLSKIYNAVIIPERNSVGLALIAVLQDKYNAKIWKSKDDDKLGFLTNTATRSIAITYAQQLLGEGYIKIHSLHTLQELISFVNHKGKYQASPGSHDDEVSTIWIFSYAVKNGLINEALAKQTMYQVYANNNFNNPYIKSKYAKSKRVTGY